MTDIDPATARVDLIDSIAQMLYSSRQNTYQVTAHTIVNLIRTDPALRAALLGAPAKAPSRPLEATAGPLRPPEPPAAEQPTGAPERPEPTAQQERRRRYHAAIRAPYGVNAGQVVNAAMEVADAEQADLKAEVEQATRSQGFWQESYVKMQQGWHEDAERLKEEATWAQLRAETGAERAQGDANVLLDTVISLEHEVERRGATIERVKALADSWSLSPKGRSKATWDRIVACLRAALVAPTEPGPDLDVSRDAPTGRAEPPWVHRLDEWNAGPPCGLWVGNAIQTPAGVPASDPPKSSLTAGGVESPLNPAKDPPTVDPLAETRARLERAMKGMAP